MQPLCKFAWICLATALSAGCSVPGPARLGGGITTYTLEPAIGAIPRAQETYPCLTVVVPPPRTAPGYATADMVYVQEEPRLDVYASHRWADTPARMLHDDIIGALEQTGAFGAVLAAPTPANAELRLDTRVAHLRQRFDGDEGASRLQFALEASLVRLEDGRLLGKETFAVDIPADPDPRGGAVAANRAAAEALARTARFTLKSVADAKIRCPAAGR